ncbi:cytochrome P450 [Tanacetum coccineum]
MEYSTLLLALSFLVTFIYGFSISNRRRSRLPPGPYPLPIIGNILALGDKPHRSLTQLSTRYGPLMSLKLGSITTIVVSSSEIAKEFFLTHDKAFSNRSIPNIAKLMDHHEYSITWLPTTGDEWRKQRRITKGYLFSGPSLEASERLRSEKNVFENTTITTLPNLAAGAEYKNLLTILVVDTKVGMDCVWPEYAVIRVSIPRPSIKLEFALEYYIPESLHPELPGPKDNIVDFPEGKVGVYTKFFEFANYRIPISQFLFERVFPTVVDWRTSAPKDERPAADSYSAVDVATLNLHRTSIQKQPEEL